MAEQEIQENPNSNQVVGDPAAIPSQNDQLFIAQRDPMSPEFDAQGNEIGVSNANIPGTVSPLRPTGNQVVGQSGIDPTRLSGQLVGDPTQFMQNDMMLSDQVEGIDPTIPGTNIDPTDSRFATDPNALNINAQTGVVDTAVAAPVTDARTYNAETSFDRVAQQDMEAATGEVSDKAVIDASTIEGDVDALEDRVSGFASQNISNVIDTSTTVSYTHLRAHET